MWFSDCHLKKKIIVVHQSGCIQLKWVHNSAQDQGSYAGEIQLQISANHACQESVVNLRGSQVQFCQASLCFVFFLKFIFSRIEFQRKSESPLLQKLMPNLPVRIHLDSCNLSKVSHKLNRKKSIDSTKFYPVFSIIFWAHIITKETKYNWSSYTSLPVLASQRG